MTSVEEVPGTGLSPSGDSPVPGTSRIPLLARHAGVWEGEYTHIAPDRSIQERLLFRILVEVPDAGPVAYRQTSHYWWEDGRTQQLMYEGAYRDGRIVIDNGRIHGTCCQVDDLTLYIRFAFHAEPAGYVCEMIQLSPDGAHRARTWHWFRDHVLWRITLVREQRAGLDPASFTQRAGTPPGLEWRP